MKTRILYYALIIPMSRLPFWTLYLLSDLIFVFVYHLIGYRRKVVYDNLQKSFPEKQEQALKVIEKEFYRHLSDMVVESIKTFSISAEESVKRLKVRNPELMESFFKAQKSVVAVGGHNGNWELYAVVCAMQIKHDVVALYTPLANAFFDKKMRSSRQRYGLKMIPTRDNEQMMEDLTKPTMYIFGIDQCPKKSQRAYWMEFLNQETGVQFGAEKFARTHNLPVIFGNIHKVKRGYYEVEYQVVCEDPAALEVGEIVKKSTQSLEDIIKKQPEYWLWSHKRWKHSKEESAKAKEGQSKLVV